VSSAWDSFRCHVVAQNGDFSFAQRLFLIVNGTGLTTGFTPAGQDSCWIAVARTADRPGRFERSPERSSHIV